MATEGHAPTASEYVIHHLTHLNNTGHAQENIIDWSVINLDSMFYSIVIGALTVFLLWLAARRPWLRAQWAGGAAPAGQNEI